MILNHTPRVTLGYTPGGTLYVVSTLRYTEQLINRILIILISFVPLVEPNSLTILNNEHEAKISQFSIISDYKLPNHMSNYLNLSTNSHTHAKLTFTKNNLT